MSKDEASPSSTAMPTDFRGRSVSNSTNEPSLEGETPRTDTVAKAIGNLGHDKYNLAIRHARQLERELVEFMRIVDAHSEEIIRLRRELAEARGAKHDLRTLGEVCLGLPQSAPSASRRMQETGPHRTISELLAALEPFVVNADTLYGEKGVTYCHSCGNSQALGCLPQCAWQKLKDLSTPAEGGKPRWTPKEAKRLLDFQHAHCTDDHAEAYHQIYWMVTDRAADPFHPWAEVEAAAKLYSGPEQRK